MKCCVNKGEKAGLRYSSTPPYFTYSACTPLYCACTPPVLCCTPLYSAVLHSYSGVLESRLFHLVCKSVRNHNVFFLWLWSISEKKYSRATISKDFLSNGKDWLYLLRQSNGVAITDGESKEKTDPPVRRMRFPKVSKMLMSSEVIRSIRWSSRELHYLPSEKYDWNSFSIWQYIQRVAIHSVGDLSLI